VGLAADRVNRGDQLESYAIRYAQTPDTIIWNSPANPTDDFSYRFDFYSVTKYQPFEKFECDFDASGWMPCASPFTGTTIDGTHTFLVRAIEQATGLIDPTPASYTWTVDGPPDTVIDGGPEGWTSTTNPTFTFHGVPDPAHYECSLDSETRYSRCDSGSVTYSNLSEDEEHVFRARATDSTGHTDRTPAERRFMIDTSPPSLTITKPRNGLVVNDAQILPVGGAVIAVGSLTIEAKASDAESGLTSVVLDVCDSTGCVRTDLPPEGDGTYTYDFSGHASGSYTVKLTATNRAGTPRDAVISLVYVNVPQ
jgi:hypothetical protein